MFIRTMRWFINKEKEGGWKHPPEAKLNRVSGMRYGRVWSLLNLARKGVSKGMVLIKLLPSGYLQIQVGVEYSSAGVALFWKK